MNTPTHVIFNMLVQGRRERPKEIGAIVGGALLPDLCMIFFYTLQKLVFQTPESTIWGDLYFQQHWQNFFDLFNSIPLLLILLALAWWLNWKTVGLIAIGMLLHVLTDLPVHREDAHHHLFPLSDWAFISPVSYWDPCHYGGWFAAFEALLIIGGGIYLWLKFRQIWIRAIIGLILMSTVVFVIFVMTQWMPSMDSHRCGGDASTTHSHSATLVSVRL